MNRDEITGRERSLANLRPFKPGESGNPRGRPPGPSPTKQLEQELREHPERLKKIVKRLLSSAEHGSLRAAELIFDRLDGKAISTLISDQDVHITIEREPLEDELGAARAELTAAIDQSRALPAPVEEVTPRPDSDTPEHRPAAKRWTETAAPPQKPEPVPELARRLDAWESLEDDD